MKATAKEIIESVEMIEQAYEDTKKVFDLDQEEKYNEYIEEPSEFQDFDEWYKENYYELWDDVEEEIKEFVAEYNLLHKSLEYITQLLLKLKIQAIETKNN